MVGLIKRGWEKPSRLEAVFIVLFFAYFLVWGLDGVFRGGGIRELDRPSRFLFALFALFAVRIFRPSPLFLWIGVAFGAVLSGIIAFWEVLFVGVDRANGFAQTNQFGKISALLSLLSGAAALRYFGGAKTISIVLFTAGMLGGLFASLMSGSRGAWLGYAMALPVLISAAGWRFGWARASTFGGVLILAASFSGVTLIGSGWYDRIEQLHHQVANYVAGADKTSSIGARFELWRVGVEMGREKPVFGRGEEGVKARLSSLADEGVLDSHFTRFSHLHNEFLDSFVKHGVLGLLIYSGLIFGPIMVFIRNGRRPRGGCDRVSLVTSLGILGVSFFGFGLAQTNFGHNSGVMVFSFLLMSLVGLLVNDREGY